MVIMQKMANKPNTAEDAQDLALLFRSSLTRESVSGRNSRQAICGNNHSGLWTVDAGNRLELGAGVLLGQRSG
jgi:hypothetical protein